MHLEVSTIQGYKVTLAIQAIIKALHFKTIYNLFISFSPSYDFNQGSYQ